MPETKKYGHFFKNSPFISIFLSVASSVSLDVSFSLSYFLSHHPNLIHFSVSKQCNGRWICQCIYIEHSLWICFWFAGGRNLHLSLPLKVIRMLIICYKALPSVFVAKLGNATIWCSPYL